MEVLSILLFLLALVAFAGVPIGLVGLLFRKFRSRAKKITALSVAILIVSLFSSGYVERKIDDTKSQQKGFQSSQDEKAAKDAGFINAKDWIAHKTAQEEKAAADAARAQAEAAERKAKEEAQAVALLAEAQKAGFSNINDYQSAKALGLNADGWKKHILALEKQRVISARLERLKKANSDIVFIEEADMNDVSGLFVKIKTKGLDGGTLDFHAFGNAVSALAAQLRKETTSYVKLRVGLVIPALDKYGNAEDANGGDIDWKVSELAKVNLDAGPQYVLRAADKVQLKRLGAEIARYYCARNELDDLRYCRMP